MKKHTFVVPTDDTITLLCSSL